MPKSSDGEVRVPEKDPRYQYGFSATHSTAMHDVERRTQKARKAMAVIASYVQSVGRRTQDLSLLDIGCSTGYLTRHYGRFFRRVVGIDIDADAVAHARAENASASVTFEVRDAMDTGFARASFDAVTCSHIYEHVPDARRLLREIDGVLKPGGFCYFAAGNRLRVMEEHYRLPLLSVVPKSVAHRYIRWTGKADSYYETHASLWGLRKLVKGFRVVDYTREVLRDPVRYCATEMLRPGSLKQKLALAVLVAAYWAVPTYVWILEKPVKDAAA